MWQINLVDNTVEISRECAEDLMVLDDHTWSKDYYGEDDAWPTDEFGEGGTLVFDDDHMEHMDYMHDPKVQAILLKHKVNGEIIFNSFEGDNRGQAWGYVFKDGVCTHVAGSAKTMRLKPI